jgi:hypothetical protein
MGVQGGSTANYTGKILQKYISDRLKERGYTFVSQDKFMPSRILEQPIFTEEYRQLCLGIYETPIKCDFILYHPKKWPDNLVIEAKWQQTSGSVDEKYPYNVLNIQTKYPYPAIIVIGGSGYKRGAEKWLRDQVKDNLLHVFNMEQFATWANKGNI